jgi:hypothetical protein
MLGAGDVLVMDNYRCGMLYLRASLVGFDTK